MPAMWPTKTTRFSLPEALTALVDQNAPRQSPTGSVPDARKYTVCHTSDVSLSGRPNEDIFAWAQQRQVVILAFDEDFAVQRSFPIGSHAGIIRLRVWPTTIEETQNALE